jgi:hypothetical protein
MTSVMTRRGTITMKINVYEHHDGGYVANATNDDGSQFLGEAQGVDEDAARHALQEHLLAQLEASADAKPEQVRLARERIKADHVKSIAPVSLSHLSDGELGQVVRASMQHAVAAEAKERRDASLADKALVKASEVAALKHEQEVRKHGAPMPGFTAYGLTVPELDLRDVDVHSVADATTLTFYSALNVLRGEKPLDRDTTTYAQVAAIHVIAGAKSRQIVAVLTAGQFAKVQTLVSAGIDEAKATELVLSL